MGFQQCFTLSLRNVRYIFHSTISDLIDDAMHFKLV